MHRVVGAQEEPGAQQPNQEERERQVEEEVQERGKPVGSVSEVGWVGGEEVSGWKRWRGWKGGRSDALIGGFWDEIMGKNRRGGLVGGVRDEIGGSVLRNVGIMLLRDNRRLTLGTYLRRH
jgi:hypothetical protein